LYSKSGRARREAAFGNPHSFRRSAELHGRWISISTTPRLRRDFHQGKRPHFHAAFASERS
jgi:hypothetical protein